MKYMHNRIVSINTMGKTPDLTPEFCEALGRAIMWDLPDQTTGSDTIDCVDVYVKHKETFVRFSTVKSEDKDVDGYPRPFLRNNVRNALAPIDKDNRLTMGVVQHNDGSWSLNT